MQLQLVNLQSDLADLIADARQDSPRYRTWAPGQKREQLISKAIEMGLMAETKDAMDAYYGWREFTVTAAGLAWLDNIRLMVA